MRKTALILLAIGMIVPLAANAAGTKLSVYDVTDGEITTTRATYSHGWVYNIITNTTPWNLYSYLYDKSQEFRRDSYAGVGCPLKSLRCLRLRKSKRKIL